MVYVGGADICHMVCSNQLVLGLASQYLLLLPVWNYRFDPILHWEKIYSGEQLKQERINNLSGRLAELYNSRFATSIELL